MLLLWRVVFNNGILSQSNRAGYGDADFARVPVQLDCGHVICRQCAFQCIVPHTPAELRRDTSLATLRCAYACEKSTIVAATYGVCSLPLADHHMQLLRRQAREAAELASRQLCHAHPDESAAVECKECNLLFCSTCDTTVHALPHFADRR